MTGKKIDRRKKLIQLIHIAKSKLQMSDGDYRALLVGIGGKTSSAELTVAELEQVFKAFKSLGFTVKKLPVTDLDRGLASDAQLAYIKGMWELVSREKTERSLNRFVRRITGAVHLRFLNVYSAQKVTIALRTMMIDAGYDPDGIAVTEAR
ncbi:regulatory protein GemA [Treponema socranskii subsp. buccale]|uniref:regulatory protein GemA n=1 Tax=Treponema socranskii TaxID=53419 RepID=UPI0020A2F7C9|nr:regulatory protein GemA [Treponema socranskii]UTD02524.1 regulatory protein GemA [Treponema socranskii subsp. buccale]